MVKRNSYVDDIINSFKNVEECKKIIAQIESMIGLGNFKMKGWICSGDRNVKECINSPVQIIDENSKRMSSKELDSNNAQKVLGVHWEPESDYFQFNVTLNYDPKKRGIRMGPDLQLSDIVGGIPVTLTKRLILSWVNGLYDPIGLIAPFTVKAKIMMRKLWMSDGNTLGWDDKIPKHLQDEWNYFFIDMFDVRELYFKRCIKPLNVYCSDPVLIVFCDSSELAFGACAYVRWKLCDGAFYSRLLMAKTHVAP